MRTLHELCDAVRFRRQDIGLSQESLAKMTGVDLETIAQIEAGTITDICLSQSIAVLEALGLRLAVDPAHPRLRVTSAYTPPLEIAARTASTSYRTVIAASTLGASFVTGAIPSSYEPHVRTLLEEAPVALLARVVEQIHTDSQMGRDAIWANMRRLACELKVRRDIWHLDA